MAIIKLARNSHREYYSRLVSDNGESARESDIRERVIDNREKERYFREMGCRGVSLPIGGRAGFAGPKTRVEQAKKCTRHD